MSANDGSGKPRPGQRGEARRKRRAERQDSEGSRSSSQNVDYLGAVPGTQGYEAPEADASEADASGAEVPEQAAPEREAPEPGSVGESPAKTGEETPALDSAPQESPGDTRGGNQGGSGASNADPGGSATGSSSARASSAESSGSGPAPAEPESASGNPASVGVHGGLYVSQEGLKEIRATGWPPVLSVEDSTLKPWTPPEEAERSALERARQRREHTTDTDNTNRSGKERLEQEYIAYRMVPSMGSDLQRAKSILRERYGLSRQAAREGRVLTAAIHSFVAALENGLIEQSELQRILQASDEQPYDE